MTKPKSIHPMVLACRLTNDPAAPPARANGTRFHAAASVTPGDSHDFPVAHGTGSGATRAEALGEAVGCALALWQQTSCESIDLDAFLRVVKKTMSKTMSKRVPRSPSPPMLGEHGHEEELG